MALIDVVTWTPDGGEFIFAYKYPESNLSTYTQLIVYESQEALLFSKGELMGQFGPGKHQLNTENLPILSSLYGLPFGGKNPFFAEIWYVNKLLPANLAWKINRMTIHDVDYDTQLPLTAFGQYGVKVINSARFLKRLVGTKNVFTQSDMVSQAWGEFSTKVKSTVVQFMTTNRVGFKYISAYLDQLSNYLKENLTPFWEEYGLELTKFYVSSIDIDDSTPDGRKVKNALSEQSAMSITGHTWQEERDFGKAEQDIGKMGGGSNGGGLLGSIMALNMMNNMQSQMGSGMMQSNYNQPHFNSRDTSTPQGQTGQMGMAGGDSNRMIFCAGCSKKHSVAERFCPHCGKEYRPCPSCGADNLENAKRCVSCGTSLVQNPSQSASSNICPSCGAQVALGAAFCSSCGASLQQQAKNICSRCGTAGDPKQKFCPTCGNKL